MSYNSKYTGKEVEELLGSIGDKQDRLVSGTTIKTINGESILGTGDIVISGSGVTEDYVNNAIAQAITTTLNTEV